MSSAPTLATFLQGAKSHLQNAITSKERVTLVMGDESADLDSVVSTILFSYLRTANPPSGAWTKVYTPLLNASRSEVGDRTVLGRLFPEVALEEQHLIAVEDLVSHGTTKSGLLAENTRFFLLKHNKMVGRLDEDYSKNVLGCIDNHKDENFVSTSTDPEPRIIGSARSCTSLVVNWGAKEWTYFEGTENQQAQTHLAKFALAPILIGTKNLSDESATEEDVRAAEFLEQKIQSSGGSTEGFDRTNFYNYLIGTDMSSSQTTTAATDTVETEAPVISEPTTDTEDSKTEEPVSKDVDETSETGAAAGGITGVATAIYSYFTGGGKKEETEEETLDTTTGPDETPREPVGTEATSDTTVAETGSYDPHAEEETTGPTGFAQRFKGDSTTAGETTTTTYAHPDTTATYGTTDMTDTTTTASGISQDVTSKMPWLATSDTTAETTTTTSDYPTTDLTAILASEYSELETPSSSSGLVGISYTSMSLTQLVAQSDRDLAHRAIARATSGTTTAEEPEQVLSGTPFTAAVRDFATKHGVSLYVVATTQNVERELFLWQLDRAFGAFIPKFEAAHGKDLGLERWGAEQEEIVKEPGTADGMMRVFKQVKGEVSRDELAKIITQSLSS